ncbi:MAG: hypothetical protein P8Z42_09550 [Anaerolineales bacterium]
MLRQDVRDAVADGKFVIYPVETIDEGMEILTGLPAGESDKDGNFPEGTMNGIVQQNLLEMAEERVRFSHDSKEPVK